MRRVLVIGVCVLALAACGRTQVKSDGTAVIHGKDGSTVTVGHNAPTNLPPYLKLYPGGAVKSTLDSGAKGGIVVVETSDAPERVIDFYKKEAAAAGLQVELENTSGDSHVVMFNEAGGGKKNFTASATKQPDGKTNIGLTYNAQA
jgi:hypothetical protein